MSEEFTEGDSFDTGASVAEERAKQELLKSFPFRFILDQSSWIAAVSIVLTDEEIKSAPTANHLKGLIKSKVLTAFDK